MTHVWTTADGVRKGAAIARTARTCGLRKRRWPLLAVTGVSGRSIENDAPLSSAGD